MQFRPLQIPDVIVIEPKVFLDHRGFFLESYNREKFRSGGIETHFVQDNHSRSGAKTLRGLHYQIQYPQAKLLRVVVGKIWDVAVDMRRNSPTFGRWAAAELTSTNFAEIYVPEGFAHGFCVLSDHAEVVYKCSDYYHPEHERTLLWNDPQLGIPWPHPNPILSDKDTKGTPFRDCETYP